MQGARVLAVFESVGRAEAAVKQLQRAGFDATRVSVIGKGDDSFGGRRPAFWRLGAALAGVAVLSVPGIGRVAAFGRLVIQDARQHAGGSRASTLATMLMRAGISAGEARTYESAVRGGQIVVLVHGAAQDVLKARGLLRTEQTERVERKEITP